MSERDSIEKEEGEGQNLDDRLRAYYGPALQEQQLPSSSWVHLRSQLGSQRSRRCRFRQRWHFHRYRGRRSTPIFIQHAFARVIHDARLPYAPSILTCSFRFRVHVPLVRVYLIDRKSVV